MNNFFISFQNNNNEMNLLFSNIKDVSNGFYSYIDSTKGEVGVVNNAGKILYSCSGTAISFETMITFFNDSYALVKVEGNDDVIISGATGEIVYKGLGINIKDNNIFSLNFNGITKYIYVYDGKVVKEFDGVSDIVSKQGYDHFMLLVMLACLILVREYCKLQMLTVVIFITTQLIILN